MSMTSIKWGNNTTGKWRADVFTLTLYETDIVVYDRRKGEVILDHGGYSTVTTKARMNKFAEVFNFNFRVFQKNGKWYVQTDNFEQPLPFFDGYRYKSVTIYV